MQQVITSTSTHNTFHIRQRPHGKKFLLNPMSDLESYRDVGITSDVEISIQKPCVTMIVSMGFG